MDSGFANRSRCAIGRTVNRPCLIAYFENGMASSNDSRGIANKSNDHGGLVRLKGLDSSETTEMNICCLVRLEDHDSFNLIFRYHYLVRPIKTGKVFTPDSQYN